jgi:hypothetical protein
MEKGTLYSFWQVILCILLFAYFPYFEKIEKAYAITLLSVCVCLRIPL